ncbi:SRPBCC family protein [Myroides guanonis]|uniref:Uncharacterized conserved protein YndB, AHSA1/START domain n=1 Tax=Myroides guanonis TaxID=1150112 RepID=A0A1I3KTI6_9FLAO|nr:SRPBCC family protein [Myroides guanonis]SFI75757.1 Uncharacterized conserved protein YndB, AHSA1/START domain [Myroides guanonis]
MITSSIKINASAEKIWQALTQKDKMKEWYFDIPDFELKEGAEFNFYEPGDARLFHHKCVIKEIVPNKKFSHTWTHPEHSKGESTVTWTLDEQENGTLVTLTHSGIESFVDAGPDFAPENYQMGWDGFMFILKNYCYGIKPRIYTIDINANAERVWSALFDLDNYKEWTSVFCPGSYYEGKLEIGSKILFLNPNGSGMFSNVHYMIYPKDLIFQHEGEVMDFKEQPLTDEVEKWSGSFERYSLKETKNGTKLIAEVDLTEEHKDYFDEHFPKGLKIVKELAEK